ncbi:peroxiredoxin [Candidatus Dependentiae bacterium]|nr:peroxiredoxin [Candidatus Dependentiae bacterium]
MSLIGKEAPQFSCDALVKGHIRTVSLKDFAEKYKILFFYPLDFSFVCPTELHSFQDIYQAVQERNGEILGISVDSVYSHQAWLDKPKAEGGIQGITYPLLSDMTKSLSRQYGILNEDKGISYRGVFLLDKNNIVQVVQVNNLNLGRNIQEILRLLDALIFTEQHGEVCPANWLAGEEGLKQTQESVIDYFAHKPQV